MIKTTESDSSSIDEIVSKPKPASVKSSWL